MSQPLIFTLHLVDPADEQNPNPQIIEGVPFGFEVRIVNGSTPQRVEVLLDLPRLVLRDGREIDGFYGITAPTIPLQHFLTELERIPGLPSMVVPSIKAHFASTNYPTVVETAKLRAIILREAGALLPETPEWAWEHKQAMVALLESIEARVGVKHSDPVGTTFTITELAAGKTKRVRLVATPGMGTGHKTLQIKVSAFGTTQVLEVPVVKGPVIVTPSAEVVKLAQYMTQSLRQQQEAGQPLLIELLGAGIPASLDGSHLSRTPWSAMGRAMTTFIAALELAQAFTRSALSLSEETQLWNIALRAKKGFRFAPGDPHYYWIRIWVFVFDPNGQNHEAKLAIDAFNKHRLIEGEGSSAQSGGNTS